MATRKKAAKKSAKKSARKPARKTTARKKATKKAGKKRTPSAAFMKPMHPTPPLARVGGYGATPPADDTEKLCTNQRHGQQDKNKRNNTNAQAKLRPVFGGKSQISMFDMTKLVTTHLGRPSPPST